MTPTIRSIDSLDLSSIANRKDERKHSKATDGKRKIPLKNIIVVEGYNFMREESDFDPVELESLADSFVEIGIQEPPKVLLLANGLAIMLDGERRLKSAIIAYNRTPALKKRFAEIECILAPKDCSDVDRLVMMLATQSRKAFNPIREGEGYKRLRDGYMGAAPLSIEEIATRVSKPVAHVESRLVLADESPEMKDLALTGKVKSTTIVALNKIEKDPIKRVAKVKEANSKGKRLQVKHILNAPGVLLLEESHAQLSKLILDYGITGEAMNLILDVQSKLLAVKNIIQ